MYINNNYSTGVGQECKSCKNNGICKWRAEKERVDKELKDISITPLAPISLSANCSSYELSKLSNDSNNSWSYR